MRAFISIDQYGNAVHQREGKQFHLENETGTGEVSLYRAFPGIELVYNDLCLYEKLLFADRRALAAGEFIYNRRDCHAGRIPELYSDSGREGCAGYDAA